MPDIFGFSSDDIARIRALLSAFEGGQLGPFLSPNPRRKLFPPVPQVVRFKLDVDVTAASTEDSSIEATMLDEAGATVGDDDGGDIKVFDLLGIFADGTTGNKGYAIRLVDDLEIIQLSCST